MSGGGGGYNETHVSMIRENQESRKGRREGGKQHKLMPTQEHNGHAACYI